MNWDAERDMARDVANNKELYEAFAADPEDGTFDAEAFLDWLDQYEGHVYAHELENVWPNFPWDGLTGQTCSFRDGELAYYQHDLRQIAEGRPNLD